MKEKEFTVSLAMVDALPVLFFAVAIAVLGTKLHSMLFFSGALLCILAGAGKVLWKFVIALTGRDITILGAQLRYLMPVGFLLMVPGVLMSDREVVSSMLHQAVRVPSLPFFLVGICGIIGMIVCSRKFDRKDVRGNWIEQGINTIAQACFMIGIILL